MTLNEPIFIVAKNIHDRNQHWRYCERKEIPYMVVAHHPKISWIDWDLWNINVVNLHLNKKATDEHSAYIDSLFKRKICSYAIKNTSIVGFLKVKRSVEAEVIETIWRIIANPKNWEIANFHILGFPCNIILEKPKKWLAKKQAETKP